MRSVGFSRILLGGVFAIAATSASAESYIGVSYLSVDYEESGIPSINPSAVVFKYGNTLNDYFGVELRLGTGLSSDSFDFSRSDIRQLELETDGEIPVGSINSLGADLSLDRYFGAYLTATLPLQSSISPYALVGFSNVTIGREIEMNIQGADYSTSDDDSGGSFSLGVGLNIKLSDSATLNGEYIQLYDKDNIKLSGPSVGINFAF